MKASPKALYHSIGEPERFWRALDNAERYFMGRSAAQAAMRKIARILEDAHIPYAVAGALALAQYGYERVTVDVDLLLSKDGLAQLKAKVLGLGYVEKFPGSKGLRDTENNVTIDVLLAGEYPGDGKPKPIAFPDPGTTSVAAGGARFLPLGTLLELKLASGMTAPHRLKDLADVIELVRTAQLPRELRDELHEYVRAKYDELWLAAQAPADDY